MSATVSSGVLFLLMFLMFVTIYGASNSHVNGEEPVMVPVIEEKMMVMLNETRRKLGSFKICAICTCCGGAKGYCMPSPCCYAINCNIPRRPFGFCSFTPRTCNCFGCHL